MTNQIEALAALIREVDGRHDLGAACGSPHPGRDRAGRPRENRNGTEFLVQ